MGYSPWGRKELDMNEHMSTAYHSRTINNLYFFPVVLDMLHKFVGCFFFFKYCDQVVFSFASPFFHLILDFFFFFFKIIAVSL